MKRIKPLINCAATILLIAIFTQYTGYLLRPLETDDAVSSIRAFHNLPENSVEVIGFGSSHMWRGMDPRIMYEEYGIAAYNYGCNWQKCNTTSLFIQDALRTQKPKVALIETFALSDMLMETDVNGEIYYTKEIDEFPGKLRYLQQCFGNEKERYLAYYMPLCAFHDNWVNLSKDSFRKISDGESYYRTMGFVGSEKTAEVEIPKPEKLIQVEFNDAAIAEISHIIQICRENDVEIVFYVAPYNSEQWQYAYGEATAKLAADYGYPFFNMFELQEEIGFDGNTDFSDPGHLNTSGAKKVAAFLGKYLKENYELTDMRTIKDNFWEINIRE